MSKPVRILVTQHDRVLYTLSATQLSELEEQRIGEEGGHSFSGGPTAMAIVQEPKVKANKCIYLDTRAPFSIQLFKHKDCPRLRSGFWHTESLNGRVRMGNAVDRSPSHTHLQATAFPFPSSHSDEMTSPTHSRRSTQDAVESIPPKTNDAFEPCGSLRQQVNEREGTYKLRISPSMRPSREDHMLAFKFKDITMKRSAHQQSPDPGEMNFTFSPVGVPLMLDQQFSDDQVSSHGRALSLDGSSPCRAITPVSVRIGQISLNGFTKTGSSDSQLQEMSKDFPESIGKDLAETHKGGLRKRKLQQGELQPLVPDSISNIHQYMSFESSAKRVNRGQYPRSQPSWLDLPHCASTPCQGRETPFEGRAYELLAQKLVKTSPWNERSLSF